MNRIEFDATLDEIVDVDMRLAEQSATHRQHRRTRQWTVGVITAGVLVVFISDLSEVPTYSLLTVAAAAGLTGGLASGFLYGPCHDSYVRNHCRRMVSEMYHGADQIHFECELRPDALWTRTIDAEVTIPWSRLSRINDTRDSIELWFDPGLIVIRDRAFRTQEHRSRFVSAVRGKLKAEAT